MEKDFIKIKPCKKVPTLTIDKKKENGWLLEIVSDRDGFTKNLKGQLYMTVLNPGVEKGYHIHAGAQYFVTCIKGNITSTVYINKSKKQIIKSGESDFKTYALPLGSAHLLSNKFGKKDAWVLCYRFPAWSLDFPEQLDINPKDIETGKAWKEINYFVKKFKNKKTS